MSTEKFDKAAKNWDGKSRRVILAEKISSAILKLPLTKEMDGMEYGCGTGLVGLAVAPSLLQLTTIDTSQGMLDVLQEKANTLDNCTVHTLCANLLNDDYNKKHDIIFCAMTLHHIQDAEGVLKCFTELLNPGGYIAIADLVTEDGSFHGEDEEGIWHKGFDTEKLGALLQDHGMGNLNTDIIHSIVTEETGRSYPVFLLTGRKIS